MSYTTSSKTRLGARVAIAALAATMTGWTAGARAQAVAPTTADLAMSCQQITDGVASQNQILKDQNDYMVQLNSKPADPGDPDPKVLTRLAQIKSAKAKTRADTLVAAGRQKKCFQ